MMSPLEFTYKALKPLSTMNTNFRTLETLLGYGIEDSLVYLTEKYDELFPEQPHLRRSIYQKGSLYTHIPQQIQSHSNEHLPPVLSTIVNEYIFGQQQFYTSTGKPFERLYFNPKATLYLSFTDRECK